MESTTMKPAMFSSSVALVDATCSSELEPPSGFTAKGINKLTAAMARAANH